MNAELIKEIYEIMTKGFNNREYYEKTCKLYYQNLALLLDDWYSKNNFSEQQILRLGLVFIFDEYRASNYSDGKINTSILNIQMVSNHPSYMNRLVKYTIVNIMLGQNIENTDDYFKLLGIDSIRDIYGDDKSDKRFFRFIIDGTPIKEPLAD